MRMFINISYVKKTAAALAAAIAIVSCARLDEAQEQGVGRLTISDIDVDVTVDMMMPAKSASLPSIPDPSGVVYKVTDAKGKVYQSDTESWAEPLVIPVGEYTVEAWSGENGFEYPYFYGSKTGTIGTENKIESVSLSVANSLLAVTVSSELEGHFTPGTTVTLSSGSTKHTAAVGEYCFVPSGKDLTLTLSGKDYAGKQVEFTYTLSSPAKKTAYEVICGKTSANWPTITLPSDSELKGGAFEKGLYFNPATVSNMSDENAAAVKYQIVGGDYTEWTDVTVMPVGDYKYIAGLSNGKEYKLRAYVGNVFSAEQTFTPVSYASCVASDVTAVHNNTGNPSAMLESTSVSAAVSASLPAIVAELATSQKATFTFDNERVEQTILKVNAAKQTLQNADGWPYLPQGAYSYTAQVALTLQGSRTVTADIASSVSVPAPEFTVTVSAYTSYDKYAGTNGNDKDVTAANSVSDAATMYGISGGAGIAVALLDNANYGEKDFKMTLYHADTKETETLSSLKASTGFGVNVATIGDKSGLSWNQHDLTVSMTFDGVTVSKTNHHYITGLPYTAEPPKNSGDYAWEVSGGGSWDGTDKYAKLSHGGGECTMTSIGFYIPKNINVKVGAKYDVVGKAIGTTFTLSLGTTTVFSTKASSYKTESVDSSEVSEMTSSNNEIICKNSYGLGATHSKVYKVSLEYSNDSL